MQLPLEALPLVADRFKALAEPTRLRILGILCERAAGGQELLAAVATSQANLSKHLSALIAVGFVGRRREGVSATYFLADPTVRQLCDLVCRQLKLDLERKVATMAATLPAPARRAKRRLPVRAR